MAKTKDGQGKGGTKPEAAKAPGGDQVVRVTSDKSTKIFSDLFKLEVAVGKRHIGWKAEKSNLHYEDVEHVHFFHTFKTNGQPNEFSNEVAGHYHRVKVVMEPVDPKDWIPVDPEQPNGPKIIRQGAPTKPKRDANGHLVVKVSPALYKKKVGRGVDQKMVDAPVPLWKEYVVTNPETQEGEEKTINDTHTHTATYRRSDLLEKVNLTPAAIVAASAIQATDSKMLKLDKAGQLVRVEPNVPTGAVE